MDGGIQTLGWRYHTDLVGAPTFSRLSASNVRKGRDKGHLDRWLCVKPTASRRSTLSLILSDWLGRLLAGLLLAASVRGWGAETPVSLDLQTTSDPAAWTISFHGQKVLVYSFDPRKFKPYVKELYTLKGVNILRDAPHDHLHHHALMYGIKVNGINFWEEVSGNGVEKVIESSKPTLGFVDFQGQKLPQARFSQVLHWVAPQDAFLPDNAPIDLLLERRVLTLTLNPAMDEVSLEWRGQFEVGRKTNTVELGGLNYHGLGLRFPEEFDPLAAHSLAGVRPDLANRRQDVSPAPWASVSFDAPGRPATVAVAGHPSNPRGDAVFFSMLSPFAYLSATQRLDQEPLIYHSGEKFQLNYLILVSSQSKPSD